MRIARILLTVFFVITFALYGYVEIKDRKFTDHTAPEISDELDIIEISISAADEELLQGLTASDNKDGDVTSSIVVTGESEFVEKDTFRVSYAAFDEAGNVGTYTRTVKYTDYVTPRYACETPFLLTGNATASDVIKNIVVDDCLDGNIAGRIKAVVTSYDDYNLAPVTLTVSNSRGDEIKANVMIQYLESEQTSYIRPWMDSYIIYCNAGSSVNIRSWVKGIWQNSNGTTFEDLDWRYDRDMVSVDTSGVDYSMPGSYTAKVSIYDEEEERAKFGEVYVTIVVVEG